MKTQQLVKTFGLVLIAGTTINCLGGDEDKGPSTCKEAKSAYGVVVDGSQTLYVDGDKSMPWSAYCAGMASDEPKEFLELPQYSAGGKGAANYSEFTEAPPAVPGVEASETFHVRTFFQRVRIDPKTLTIDIANTAFSRNELIPTDTKHASAALDLVVGSVPFGLAMMCGDPSMGTVETADDVPAASANIDLTGLPFELAEPSLCKGTGGSTAFADPTAATKIFDFTARGTLGADRSMACGLSSVRCLPEQAVNGQVGGQIQLRYVTSATGFGF